MLGGIGRNAGVLDVMTQQYPFAVYDWREVTGVYKFWLRFWMKETFTPYMDTSWSGVSDFSVKEGWFDHWASRHCGETYVLRLLQVGELASFKVKKGDGNSLARNQSCKNTAFV